MPDDRPGPAMIEQQIRQKSARHSIDSRAFRRMRSPNAPGFETAKPNSDACCERLRSPDQRTSLSGGRSRPAARPKRIRDTPKSSRRSRAVAAAGTDRTLSFSEPRSGSTKVRCRDHGVNGRNVYHGK